MATGQYQNADSYVQGADIPVKNYGGSDIGEGLAVLADPSNPLSTSAPMGVVLPTASGGVVGTIGVTTGAIAAGKVGSIRVFGTKWMTANGSITFGGTVQASDTSAKLGYAKAISGSGTEVLGKALATASDAEKVLVLICPVGDNA